MKQSATVNKGQLKSTPGNPGREEVMEAKSGNVSLCQCGPRRRPGSISPLFLLVECLQCGLWIQPPESQRVQALLNSGFDVTTERNEDGASVNVADKASGEKVAMGKGETIQDALSSLNWKRPPKHSAETEDTLSLSAAWNPLTESGDSGHCIPCMTTPDLAEAMTKACRGMTPARWNQESFDLCGQGVPSLAVVDSNARPILASLNNDGKQGQADVQGIVFLREAAPILASRVLKIVRLVRSLLAVVRLASEQNIDAELQQAAAIAIKDMGRARLLKNTLTPGAEAAPFCPLCLRDMKPVVVSVPDPANRNLVGRVTSDRVKMVNRQGWVCACR